MGGLAANAKRDEKSAETLTNASDQLLDYSERFMRAEIAEMPDGVYYAQDQMEDDGVTQRPYWMRLRLTIRGDDARHGARPPHRRRPGRHLDRRRSPIAGRRADRARSRRSGGAHSRPPGGVTRSACRCSPVLGAAMRVLPSAE